jgi:hypothetical protein
MFYFDLIGRLRERILRLPTPYNVSIPTTSTQRPRSLA